MSAGFRERATAVIDCAFGGEHHVGKIAWTDHANWPSCKFSLYCGEAGISTFDFSELTRLVVAAHDHCVRACVIPSGPRMIGVVLYERKRPPSECDPVVTCHPDLEAHVAAIREGGGRAMQRLYDSMRDAAPREPGEGGEQR